MVWCADPYQWAMVLSAKSLLQEDGREVQLPPQERVAAVRPFWETLTQEDRVELLSITVEDLQARSKEVVARLRRQAGMQHHQTKHASTPLLCPEPEEKGTCMDIIS